MNNENCNEKSISKILDFILELQRCAEYNCIDDTGCTKPSLGPNTTGLCFNTRPITLYSCCSGNLWSMPYTLNGVTSTSTVFKINKVDCNCATFEILAPNPEATDLIPYISTNNYFTICLDCVLAIRCLNDTYTN